MFWKKREQEQKDYVDESDNANIKTFFLLSFPCFVDISVNNQITLWELCVLNIFYIPF